MAAAAAVISNMDEPFRASGGQTSWAEDHQGRVLRRVNNSIRLPPSRPEEEMDELALNLPPPSQRILSSLMQKKTMTTKGVVFETRQVMLTSERMLFADASGQNVRDSIPLHEILSVDVIGDDQNVVDSLLMEEEHKVATPSVPHITVNGKYMALGDLKVEKDQKTEAPAGKRQIVIQTVEDGYNAGRSYIYRTNEKEASVWKQALNEQVGQCISTHNQEQLDLVYGHSGLAMRRARAQIFYDSNNFQLFVASLIIVGFLVDLIEAQLMPADGSVGYYVFLCCDIGLSSAFFFELLLNLFANSANRFRAFVSSSSNWFDALIVLVSLGSLSLVGMGIDIGIPVKMLRLFRVVRVVRLFKNFRDLNRIVTALSSSIYPVCNSFFILLVCTSMYATLGTHVFGNQRREFFGDFQTSLFTMIQVVSGDSWASAISRGLFNELDSDGNAKTDPLVAFFFVSYFLVASIVLLNVVVAVLLDEFMASVAHEKDEMMAELQAEAEKKRITGVLDPITQRISSFDDLEDLRAKIQQIYEQLDDDQSGGLTFLEFKKNLKRLPQTSAIHMTQDDFDLICDYGRHLNASKEFGPGEFQTMMMGEETKSNEFKSTVLMLKMMETKILSMELKILSAINGLASTDANGSKDPNCSHPASASARDGHPRPPPPVAGGRGLVPHERPLDGEVAGELARVSSGIADLHAGMQELRDRQDGLDDSLAEHQRHVTAQLEALLQAVTAVPAPAGSEVRMTVAASGAARRPGMTRDVASRVAHGYPDEEDDALYGGKASTRGAGAVGGGRSVGGSAVRAATYISSPPPLEPKPLSSKGMYARVEPTSVRAEVGFTNESNSRRINGGTRGPARVGGSRVRDSPSGNQYMATEGFHMPQSGAFDMAKDGMRGGIEGLQPPAYDAPLSPHA